MYILFKNNTNGTYATVPANGITELAQEASLFSGETFYLGSTVCRSFKLGIDKRFVNFVPGDAAIIYEGMPKYADLVVDNTDDEDVKAYKFTLTDRMVRLNEQDSSWFTSGKTIQQLLSAICTQYGIAGVDTIAAYGDVAITWYDNWTARDFVSWVAELLGGYAYISANNYLKFDTYSNTPVQTIPVENCDSFKLGEQITIDRVVYDLPGKTVKYPVDYSGTGCTLYLNTDNALFTDSGGLSIEDQVEYIYNVINGFSFYNIKVGKCPINRDVRAGQCIGFSLDGTVYNTIAQVNWNYNSMWLGGYELKLDSPVQAETQIVGAAKKTQTIIQKIDREIGEISSTVASVQETVEDVQGDVGTLQGNVSTIQGDIGDLQGDVGELGDSLDGVNTQITTINTNVSNITQTTQNIQTQVTQTQTTLKNVQGDVGTLQGNVSTLQGNVGDLQGDVDDLGDSLDGVNTQITTINNNVSNITQTAQSIQTQVTQTQTTLKDNYATKEQLSSSVSSLSSTIEQTASGINVTISNVQSTVNSQGSQITTLETYIGATSRGLEIGRNTDDVKAVLGNNELAFYDKGNTKLAWLNSDEGLGATGLSIGNATTANQRWRVFTRQNGSHLTFTRHS